MPPSFTNFSKFSDAIQKRIQNPLKNLVDQSKNLTFRLTPSVDYCSCRNGSMGGLSKKDESFIYNISKRRGICRSPYGEFDLLQKKAFHSSSSQACSFAGPAPDFGMGLSKKDQSFIYNILKRRGICRSPYGEFGFLQKKAFHSSSQACSCASPAPDMSLDKSLQDEQLSISADDASSSEKIPEARFLKLDSGSCYLPHPDKEETGGEDAHFISSDDRAIGVADGVGGWSDLGVDAGYYARELMSNSVAAIEEEPKGCIDTARVLKKAYAITKSKGSSTACIIALTDEGLHAINLGDSGFMVIRGGSIVFRSSVQQHDFNFTYQLESGNSRDLPGSGQVFTISVAPGDVIIAGSDGLFDNLYTNDITGVVVHAVRAGLRPRVTAQQIAALARERALDKNRQTPFSTAAQNAGFRYHGGKLDDITVVVCYIISDNKV